MEETPIEELATPVEPDDVEVGDEADLQQGLDQDGNLEASDKEREFLENLQKMMVELSPDCRSEFESALQTQDMESMSEPCRLELSRVAEKVQAGQKKPAGKQRASDEEIQKLTDEALKKMGYDTNTKYKFGAVLVFFFVCIAAYVWYVNKELSKAGVLSKKQKPLSKKKLEKQRAKTQKSS